MYSHPTFHNKDFLWFFIMQNIKAGGYNSCTPNKEYPFLQIQELSSDSHGTREKQIQNLVDAQFRKKKKNWFHWFKTIKILGTKTKLSKSSIDLNEKWENLGKVVTARNVRGRGRRLWETCAVGDGIKGRQVRARAPAKKNYDDWFCRFFCSYKECKKMWYLNGWAF